jgi:hypothetical protein
LSLIQPSVLAFTPPGTRILRITTAAINTKTAPTISSIWFSTWRHYGHRRHCIGGPCCSLFAIAQRMTWAWRLYFSRGCAPKATHVLHWCQLFGSGHLSFAAAGTLV